MGNRPSISSTFTVDVLGVFGVLAVESGHLARGITMMHSNDPRGAKATLLSRFRNEVGSSCLRVFVVLHWIMSSEARDERPINEARRRPGRRPRRARRLEGLCP